DKIKIYYFQFSIFMASFDFKKEKAEEELERIYSKQQEKRAKELAQSLNIPYIDLVVNPIELDALALVPEAKARGGLFVPFQKVEKRVAIATFDPKNDLLNETIKELEKKGFKVQLFICSQRSLKRAFEEYKKAPSVLKSIVGKIELSSQHLEEIERKIKSIPDLKEELKNVSHQTGTWIIEVILGSSLSLEASDIHIVPEEEGTKVRLRIDGILHDVAVLNNLVYNSLLNRIKLLSNLIINVHNIPQDGRFSIFAEQKEIEVRVSIVPGEYGEDIVMRILNPEMILSIEELGFHPWHQEEILRQIKKSTGMILTSGPTGSGKTTTLYACLKKVATPEVKVISIEDPIEYHLEGVSQTQVEPEKGYDFASALRAAMRQDPDVILVGEIRDRETAETAIQAALTGHLVFSTIHTNDAAGIIPRLVEMGVNPSLIPPALNLGIAQRLLRRVCKKCAKKITLSEEMKKQFERIFENLPSKIKPNLDNIEIFQANGCIECHNTGYRGRIGIFEMFKMSPRVEEIILTSPSISAMRKTIAEEGMINLKQDALLRVVEGITTVEELERVVGPLEE
ncbi:MAG TPA: GspE/PulE family protein, partial [Candidatus Pacearchaeota archaeon]|nr:GspE/PulE family protein [Candidatus Pacearchaeota archaeon]